MIFFVKLAAILTAITRWFDVGEAQCAGNSDVIVENGPCSYSIHATASFFTVSLGDWNAVAIASR